MNGGGEQEALDWSVLVPFFIHPVQVAVIEAMWWIDEPLSATLLKNVFDEKFDLSIVSYHVATLAKQDILKKVGQRHVRGAREKFYRLSNFVGRSSPRRKASRS